MKRFLALLLAVLMVFALVGCAGDEPVQEATEETPEVPEVPAEDMIVGFIYVGPIGDGGWTYSHDLGRLYLEDQLGVKTIYKESVPETQEVESEIRNMIDQGATAIFATSFGFMDYVEKMSNEFPDVAFFHCSGYKTTDNMANYFGRMYEARYLSGIAAALKTETNKLGYVAAFDIPEVIRGINAFTLGAQSVNPEVEVEVVWTYTWYDPAIEKSAAIALLDGGADIIAQHQDTTGPQQAAEERGVYSIGYNTDMSEMAPEAYITAPIWNWGPYYVEQVQAVMDGSFESHAYWGEIEDGIVELAPLTKNAAEGTADAIADAEAKIIDNSLHVFAGPIFNQAGEVAVEDGKIMTDDEMLNMKWFVQGVKGEISE
jgi:basic membrane protein A